MSTRLQLPKPLMFALWGGAGGFIGDLIGETFTSSDDNPMPMLQLLAYTGLWFALIGCLIALAIAIGQSRYLGKKSVGRAHAATALFGFAAAFAAGDVAQITYNVFGQTELLRDACWGIAGALIGAALSFRVPNLGFLRGLLGGVAGGIIGGGIFILLAYFVSARLGRLVGVTAIGFMIGLMIAISERLFREAWLEVSYGPRETRNITLGSKPVRIGSDASSCDVYVRDVAPVAYVYTLTQKRIVCEDNQRGRVDTAVPGDLRTIGNVSILVRGG